MRPIHATAAALLLAAVPLAAVAVPAAAADPPPSGVRIDGYVWGHDPTNPDYLATTGYEHNSAGGAIRITHDAAGTYHVRFVGMAGAGGVAHVGAYGSNAVCVLTGYGPAGLDEWVHLRCFDPAGALVNTRFIASVTNRRPPAAYGFLRNDDPVPPAAGHIPPAGAAYDSAGLPIIVYRTAVGAYEVELGTFAADSAGAWALGSVVVTAFSGVSKHCQMMDPAFAAVPSRISVHCYDDTGFAVDTRFTLTYSRGATLLGNTAARGTATIDHYLAAPTLKAGINTALGAPVPTDLAGVGSYQVSFPNLGAPRGFAYGTVIGTPPAYCNIHSWWVTGTTQNIWLKCYDGGVGVATPAVLYNVGFIP